MSTERYPTDDQMVTAVTVREGNARVLAGTVLVAKPRGIVVRFDEPMPEKGQVLTLLYGGSERVLRLRTRVSEIIGDGKVLVEPQGAVTEGERREFLRAEAELPVKAEAVGAGTDLPSPGGAKVSTWKSQVVDLSGSGVSFTHDSLADKGDLFLVQFVVPSPPDHVVQALGEVVRCSPEDGAHRIAVHFITIREEDRDVVINFVFRRYYEALAHQLHTDIEPEA